VSHSIRAQCLGLRRLDLLVSEVVSRIDEAVHAGRGRVAPFVAGAGATPPAGQMERGYVGRIVERHAGGDSIPPVAAVDGIAAL